MAGIISRKSIDQVRFQCDIVDVVGSYISLKRAGSAFKTTCPFHKEKTPSFTVNPERQIYHCFGCGAGGDVFRFVMEYETVDFGTAAKMLAERAGIAVEYEKGSGSPGEDKSDLYRVMEDITQFYRRVLNESKAGEPARSYLQERNLPATTVDEFMIGFAPERWDSILKWGQKHKVKYELLEKLGMIIKSTKENSRSEYYDRFRNRVMFPIRDAQGRIIGFSGRTLDADNGGAKYVNSPETPLFQKSRVLYGLYQAKRPIVDSREAIICEGQIDVIRCHQAGFNTAVAAQGTAFTQDHARIISRYADSIVLVFDPDTAGQNAAIKTAGVFIQAGLAVRVASLPDGKDPDTFIDEKGAEAFQAVLDGAMSAVAFQIEILRHREQGNTEAGLMRVSKAVLGTISLSSNAVQQARLLQETAEILDIPQSALKQELQAIQNRTARREQARSEYGRAEEEVPELKPCPPEELDLITHLVGQPDLVALTDQYLPSKLLQDERCKTIVSCISIAADEGRDLMSTVDDHDSSDGRISRLLAELQMAPEKVEGREASREQAVKDLILFMWRRKIKADREADLKALEQGKHSKNTSVERIQAGHDLGALKDWEMGSAIIEVLMEE